MISHDEIQLYTVYASILWRSDKHQKSIFCIFIKQNIQSAQL